MGASMLANTDKETYWREIAAMVEGRFFATERATEGDSN